MEAAISAWDNIYHRMGPINRRLSFPMALVPRWLVGLQLMPILLGILTNSDRQRNYHDKWWFRSKWLTTVCLASQIKNVFSLEVEVKFSDLSHRMALINHHENIITSLCIAEPNEWQPSNSAANDAHVYLFTRTNWIVYLRQRKKWVCLSSTTFTQNTGRYEYKKPEKLRTESLFVIHSGTKHHTVFNVLSSIDLPWTIVPRLTFWSIP